MLSVMVSASQQFMPRLQLNTVAPMKNSRSQRRVSS